MFLLYIYIYIYIINYIISWFLSLKLSVYSTLFQFHDKLSLVHSTFCLWKNISLNDIKMFEPVINTLPCIYCLTICWRTFMMSLKYTYCVICIYYYFAFVHYILITIIFFSCNAHLLSKHMEAPGKM